MKRKKWKIYRQIRREQNHKYLCFFEEKSKGQGHKPSLEAYKAYISNQRNVQKPEFVQSIFQSIDPNFFCLCQKSKSNLFLLLLLMIKYRKIFFLSFFIFFCVDFFLNRNKTRTANNRNLNIILYVIYICTIYTHRDKTYLFLLMNNIYLQTVYPISSD